MGRIGAGGGIQELRHPEVEAGERTLRESPGAPGEHRRGLFAGRSQRPDDFSRQRQDGFPGQPDGERRDARDQQNPGRPGPGEIRERLCVAAVRLEKRRDGEAALPFGWESAGDISIREPRSEKTFRGPGRAAARHGRDQLEARRARHARAGDRPARRADARSAQRAVSEARAGDVRSRR